MMANCPLLRYKVAPFEFGGKMFNSAPPGRRANSDVPLEPFIVDVITGVPAFVEALFTNSLCK